MRLRIILPSLCSNVDARERALCGLILTPQSGISVSVTGERAGGQNLGPCLGPLAQVGVSQNPQVLCGYLSVREAVNKHLSAIKTQKKITSYGTHVRTIEY